MKIYELRAENMKNLKVVEITPDGNAVILTGPNGAGKSAVLDAISAALTGEKFEEPIRRGEERAEVVIDLGKYVVKRVITKKNDYLEVRSKEGAKFSSPQKLLDEIMGDLSFDPMKFYRMKPKEQYEAILEMAGIVLDRFEAKRREVYDERTLVNRQIKDLNGALSTLTRPQGAPDEEIDVDAQLALVKELQDQKMLNDINNREIGTKKSRRAEIAERLQVLEEERRKLEQELQTVNRDIERLETSALPPTDPETLRIEEEKLSQISAINQSVRDARKWNEAKAAHDEAKAKSDELTQELEKLDKALKDKVKSLDLPIDGLSIEDEQVVFNGIPLSRLSDGEKIRVSTALAMAANPEFQVIFVREGSLLDSEGLQMITDLAQERGYQLWIEKVDESGQVGIVLEDGQVVSAVA